MVDNIDFDDKFIYDVKFGEFDFRRRLRSLIQRILLLDTSIVCEADNTHKNCVWGIDFKVLGSSNTIYIVQIWRGLDKLGCSCSCLDYKMRNVYCKHIYWIGTKIFEEIEPIKWSLDKYKDIVNKYVLSEKNTLQIKCGRNDNCPICLENINYENDVTVCCKNQCFNAVHAVCWSRFYEISGNSNCVFCRKDIFSERYV